MEGCQGSRATGAAALDLVDHPEGVEAEAVADTALAREVKDARGPWERS